MKKITTIILSTISLYSYGDNTESTPAVINANSTYIGKSTFIQDPYINVTTGGGTQKISDTQWESQNFAEHVFADGTWNVMAGAAAMYMGTGSGTAGFPAFGYGSNLFGQTGAVAGFSAGAMATVANPFFARQMNTNTNAYNFNFMPANYDVNISEAFLEYQYSNTIQADIGLIGINNSPWLSMNYYNNTLVPGANYQGALVNVYPGGGWLLTALAFNTAQLLGNSGFTPGTMYNTGTDKASGIIVNTLHETSNGTMAAGANYAAWDNQYNLRIWDYQFDNYGNLFYIDNSIKFQTTKSLAFNVAAQGGINRQTGSTSAFTYDNMGDISSNFVGLQAGLSYDWFSFNIGYNNIWGPSNAYGNGAISTPYTYGFATDPLYTTPFMAGLNDMGTAGQAYKLSPSFNFLSGNLSVAPAWTSFKTAAAEWNGTNEYDLIFTYNIPQIRGFTVFSALAYQVVPEANQNGNTVTTQVVLSYIY